MLNSRSPNDTYMIDTSNISYEIEINVGITVYGYVAFGLDDDVVRKRRQATTPMNNGPLH